MKLYDKVWSGGGKYHNASLEATGALSHCLQHRSTYKNQNVTRGHKLTEGSGSNYISYWGLRTTFANLFFWIKQPFNETRPWRRRKKVGENMEKILMKKYRFKISLPVERPWPKFFVPIILLALQQGWYLLILCDVCLWLVNGQWPDVIATKFEKIVLIVVPWCCLYVLQACVAKGRNIYNYCRQQQKTLIIISFFRQHQQNSL